MNWLEIFFMVYNCLSKLIRKLFKIHPDTRYKFTLEDYLVINEVNKKVAPVFINSDFFIEVFVGGQELNIIAFKKSSNIIAISGLPLVSVEDTKINIVDNLLDELLFTFHFKKGEFIDYRKISNECDGLFIGVK